MGTLSNPSASSGAAPGTPVLYGPYVVDYTDIPHDGDTMTLWTPAVGDVLLRLFPDWRTVVQWDHGNLHIQQPVDTDNPGNGLIAFATPGEIGRDPTDGLMLAGGINSDVTDATATQVTSGAVVFATTDPVGIWLHQTGPDDPTQGHVEIFALVARAVSP